MYSVSDYARGLLDKNYRQTLRITYLTDTGLQRQLTDADVVQGSFGIDRYCASGSTIEVGSACSSELSLELDNRDGRFDNAHFEGIELFVEIGVKKWDAYNWEKAQMDYIPCGYFTVDQPPRRLATISLTALDRMVKFDKVVDWSKITLPDTLKSVLQIACTECGVLLADEALTGCLNWNRKWNQKPQDDNITYRALIQWMAQIFGACAYIDWDGKLRLEWYGDAMPGDSVKIGLSDRYSSQLEESVVKLTGVEIDDGETVYRAGNDIYPLRIENNPVMVGWESIAGSALWTKLRNTQYLPYECDVKPMPYLWPLDTVSVQDKNGKWHDSIVTHVHFGVNGKTTIKAVGETSTQAGYASSSPVTAAQATREAAQSKRLEQASMALSEMIVNAMGLYFDKRTLPDGSMQVYAYDVQISTTDLDQNLRNSKLVITVNAGGVAWTNHWDGDSTVWKNGIDSDGNAVLNTIVANKISADSVRAGLLVSEDGSTWINLDDGEFDFRGKLKLDNTGALVISGRLYGENYEDGDPYAAINNSGEYGVFTVQYPTFDDYSDLFTVQTTGDNAVEWRCMSDNGVTVRRFQFLKDGTLRIYCAVSGSACWIDLKGSEITINGNVTVNGSVNDNNVSMTELLNKIENLEARVAELEAK